MIKRATRPIIVQRALLGVGIGLLALYAAAFVHRIIGSQLALREFDEVHSRVARKDPPGRARLAAEEPSDFRLWSDQRIRAHQESLLSDRDSPLAVLTIDKLSLRIPVFEGTDEWNLNRGVGWITGTARPGEPGNIGIAGHRDGVFRALKDLAEGDLIELDEAAGTTVYSVDQIEIVRPDDVSVLRPRARPSLTLVTCYPFYYVGSAPQRYIMHAALIQSFVNKHHNGSTLRTNQTTYN